jgi:hypothetical protein
MVMTVGRLKMSRKTLRAGSRELSSMAAPSAIADCNGVTSSANRNVLRKARRNADWPINLR